MYLIVFIRVVNKINVVIGEYEIPQPNITQSDHQTSIRLNVVLCFSN